MFQQKAEWKIRHSTPVLSQLLSLLRGKRALDSKTEGANTCRVRLFPEIITPALPALEKRTGRGGGGRMQSNGYVGFDKVSSLLQVSS